MEKTTTNDEYWDLEIKPDSGLFQLHLRDVWAYRDLLMLLVRRDFVAFYKQTILGPLWFFIHYNHIYLRFWQPGRHFYRWLAPASFLYSRHNCMELLFRLSYQNKHCFQGQLGHVWQSLFPTAHYAA